MKRTRFVLTLTLITLAFSTTLYAQSIQTIINKNIEARGGLKLIKSVQSIEMSGSIVFHGMNAPFKYIIKHPDQMKLEMTVNGDSLIEAYDGTTAWASIPRNGQNILQKIPKAQSASFKELADFEGPLIDFKKKGYEIKKKGMSKIGTESAYNLVVTDSAGNSKDIFIDSQNYHNIRESSVKKIQGSGPASSTFNIVTNYSKFKVYKGLTLPYEIATLVNGNPVMQMTITKISLNDKYPESLFQFPGYMGGQSNPY